MSTPISGLPVPVFFDSLHSSEKRKEPLSPLFISPLSKENSRKKRRLDTHSIASRSLFSNKGVYGTELDSLSTIYQIDFNHPPVHGNAHDFFARANLLIEIESCLKRRILSSNIDEVRTKLASILTSKQTHRRKMGELGTFLYLLDRDKEIPPLNVSSYITLRAGEICKEAVALISQHQEREIYDEKRLIPSGKIHYLLRTFAKMILTSDQKFNSGSLHALTIILEYAELGVVRFFKPEHHAHILCVLKQMITQTSFKRLLEGVIRVHPDLAPFIRLDLKLAKEVEISSVAVMWDCIMALLFDIRQLDDPNCYAVSTLIYAIENGASKVLEKTIEWLSAGHFAFSETVTIPILPLAEHRLSLEKELVEIEMPSYEATELATFQNIASTLNLSSFSSLDTTDRSLNGTLRDLLSENNVKGELPYAQKLFYTYKHNTLIHMLVALIEFYCTNASKEEDPRPSYPFSQKKEDFLNAIFSIVPVTVSSVYLKKFKEVLGDRIWLHNCSEKDRTLKKGKIVVGPTHNRREIVFSGDLKSLSEVLSDSRRICLLDKGEYRIIETLTDLQKSVVRLAQEIESQDSASSLVDALNSRPFLNSIANFCASKLKKSKISGKCLRDSNLLLLIQTGGHGWVPLRKLFGLNFLKIEHQADNASKFLGNLYSTFKKCDSEMIAKTPVFYVQTEDHAYTLNPHYLSLLWKREDNFGKWVQNTIYYRALTLLRLPIPKERQEAIIENYKDTGSPFNKELITFFGKQRNLTNLAFRDKFLSTIFSLKHKARFLKIFDAQMMKIKLNSTSLAFLFRALNIEFDTHLFNQLDVRVKGCIDEPIQPFQMARTLYKILIDEHVGIFPPFQIEKSLCDIFKLPVPVDTGDLNWIDTNREDPVHSRACIRYHFGYQSLRFFCRNKKDEFIDNENYYKNFNVIHPHAGLVK